MNMDDQGMRGGPESRVSTSTHRRKDSSEDSIKKEKVPEAMNSPSESDSQDRQYVQPLQLPRRSRGLGATISGPGTPTSIVEPGLSRNSSSCSTSPHARSHADYSEGPPASLSRQPTNHNLALDPPVTKVTLSELDVTKIIHNPKLRHDINFDPELHFRPNLDGEKGQKKKVRAEHFWKLLTEQLAHFAADRDDFYRIYGQVDEWCLPSLLKAVKEIISTLVPRRDRDYLEEGLNISLLMQQFNRGVADLEKLSSWLCQILKLHCAPMRDEWVDDMYRQLSTGNRINDADKLVSGLRNLLSILEAMKLDVANHQIRCLRPVLIEDTVHFEQRFFIRKIQAKKFSLDSSRLWYRQVQGMYENVRYEGPAVDLSRHFGDMAAFFDGLSRLIMPSTYLDMMPGTFLFDEERLSKLKSDLFDSICLEICMRKFDDLERLSRATQSYHHATTPSCVADEAPFRLNSRASYDLNFGAPPSRPASFALADGGSRTESPRSSAAVFPPIMMDRGEARAKETALYNTLLALLHTAPAAKTPVARWEALSPPMALQVLRYVNAPPSLPGFEKHLETWLSDVHGHIFREVEKHVHERLLAELARRVKALKNLSAVALFSVATGGRVNAHRAEVGRQRMVRDASEWNRNREPREVAGLDDIALRLAHLGILHWRVWSPLAYTAENTAEMTAEMTTEFYDPMLIVAPGI